VEGFRDRRRPASGVSHLSPPAIAWDAGIGREVDVADGSRVKRAYDVVGALVLLVLFSAVMLAVAVAVKLESRGPVLYRSRRVGLRGRDFEMLKFRKMHRDAAGPPLTALDDDRLTRVGSFLSRTKLDELPQLWNVVRGEMSLVGPRPEDPAFVALYPDDFAPVLAVRPGITGLSQLAFAKESNILERPELAGRYADRLLPAKIAIDTLYVERRSTRLDTRILTWTAGAILLGREVAVDRRSARLSVRRRAEPHSPVEDGSR
jgi:lipopolysaccharide/colanic/teichoic acid biosynthesis glycosyltransferase